MWGVGCIFYEMATGLPMFPGSSTENQLQTIWEILGTPTEEEWPGLARNLKVNSLSFHKCKGEPLRNRAPRLEAEGLDLLAKFLQVYLLIDNNKRMF